ncbi:dTDP-4-dehydrorhamnose reductase [Bacillus sp. JCM 19034]|uniref:dTDP-4-dehydrorhamnose reductase n=1 Tax=Bacillus sp. JCM 19034 TaxID=1481928 RepID=UPI000783602A|nr:dTDP-4-dehydrorhamnose reductase [Bacillus sp. JCM 19034]
MNYLITGANGQLGKALKNRLNPRNHTVALSKEELDVTNESSVYQTITSLKPDVVFHAAAYTKVDLAEDERTLAFQVNALGAAHVAKACKVIGAKMVYISTDYVFDGQTKLAYEEGDAVNPLNTYGLSKWIGETFVEKLIKEHYIIRTSWLYGHGGKHFVDTMLTRAFQKKEVNVVSDQIGSPTYIEDLVDILCAIIEKPYGIYHVQNDGSCTWSDFAKEIYKLVEAEPTLVQPISTNDFGAKAARPSFSQLSMRKLEKVGLNRPPMWQEGLKSYLQREGLL